MRNVKQPDPKPRKRIVASKSEWAQWHELLRGAYCAVCRAKPADSYHHICRRSQSGDDLLVNLLPVCGSGTTGCHGRIEARDPAVLRKVRDVIYDRPATRGYLLQRKGQAWLDRAYPA